MSILEVRHLVKSFGTLKPVDDVSFSMEAGDNLAIIGESGCGKTTLAKLMMGLLKADSGSILAQGRLQMVFQDPNQSLDPLWNVQGILKEAFKRSPRQTNSEPRDDTERLKQMLFAVGLPTDILGRFPHEFSGGERQRIAIARALLAQPQILLLDEASSALDTLVQKQIMDLLKKLKQDFNLTYIFISHNLRLVTNFSDKILVMKEGKIIEQGTVATVLKSPAHPYTRQLVEAAFFIKI